MQEIEQVKFYLVYAIFGITDVKVSVAIIRISSIKLFTKAIVFLSLDFFYSLFISMNNKARKILIR